MRIRRVIGVLIVVAGVAVWWLQHYDILSKTDTANFTPIESSTTSTRAVDPNSKKALSRVGLQKQVIRERNLVMAGRRRVSVTREI